MLTGSGTSRAGRAVEAHDAVEDDSNGARLPHLPALDGLRAIALVAVLCFHAGFGWIKGGYLPLTAFFVLSGFLITSLLLLERQRTGWVDLRAFWGRRARRLVPAAIVSLALIAVYTAAVDQPTPGLRGDVFAALGWVANWRFIFADRSYADLFGDPSPLQHFWSLAVEEQFYVVLPLLFAGALWVARGRRWVLASITVAAIAASTLWMRHLYQPGEEPLRSYFGTDTRAAELLVGVLLAMVLIGPRGLRTLRGPTRALVNIAGAAALAASVSLWFVTQEYDANLYESGGLLGIALLAAVVVAAATQPGSIVADLLSVRPVAALGRISYGVYLFHWPLFLWIDEERTGLDAWPLFGLRMAVTVGLAGLSYWLLEQPIRRNTVRPRLLLTGWANASVAVAAVLVVVTSTTVEPRIQLQTADLAPSVSRATRIADRAGLGELAAGDTSTTTTTTTPPTSTSATGPGSSTTAPARRNGSSPTAPPGTSSPTNPGTSAPTAPPTTPPTSPPLVLRPARIMVVGDSISVNLADGLAAVQDTYQFDLLNYGFNGCSAAVGGTMRWPDGSLHQMAGGCYQRRSEWAAQIRSFDPDVVLIHSSIFDILDRKIDGWADFSSIGGAPFDGWLRDQQAQIIGILGAGGARVVWATTPCAQFDPRHGNHHENGEGNRRIDLLNARIRQTGATIADLDAQVCPGGGFSSTVAGVGGARPDGVHFTRTAAAALADQWLAPYLLNQIP